MPLRQRNAPLQKRLKKLLRLNRRRYQLQSLHYLGTFHALLHEKNNMSSSCDYVNPNGVKCGLPSHPPDTPHEAVMQLCEPEPFSLKASDVFTPCIIRTWITMARMMGVNATKLAKAEDHLYQIKRWQRTHGTKVPD